MLVRRGFRRNTRRGRADLPALGGHVVRVCRAIMVARPPPEKIREGSRLDIYPAPDLAGPNLPTSWSAWVRR